MKNKFEKIMTKSKQKDGKIESGTVSFFPKMSRSFRNDPISEFQDHLQKNLS